MSSLSLSQSKPIHHSSVLVIAQQLNCPFIEQFVQHLLSLDASTGRTVFALISPFVSNQIPNKFGPFLEQKRLIVAFGSAGNKKLIKRIIENNQISAVFLFLNQKKHADIKNENGQQKQKIGPSVVGGTASSSHLIELCALLEALRDAIGTSPPIFVPIFFVPSEMSAAVVVAVGGNGEDALLAAKVQCKSEQSARFSSAFALCHAYAVSYHLAIQFALIAASKKNETPSAAVVGTTVPSEQAMNFVLGLAQKQQEKEKFAAVKINIFEGVEDKFVLVGNGDDGDKPKELPGIPVGRAIVFGCSNDDADGDELNGAKEMLLNGTGKTKVPLLANGGTAIVGAMSKPGLDSDEAVEDEVLATGASHVVFVCNADEQTMGNWESGGPLQLRDNVRQNMFAPWLLRQICSKFGLQFVLMEGQKLGEQKQKNGEEEEKEYNNKQSSRCAVVRHFGQLLEQMEKL